MKTVAMKTDKPGSVAFLQKLISIALPLFIINCGSDEQTAGIDGSGDVFASDSVTLGTVDGFGSVIVNGVRYNTDESSFTIRGETSQEDDLAVGNYVTVVGSINADGVSGKASKIIFQPLVLGEISAIDLQSERLDVLGQTVFITPETQFDKIIPGRELEGLNVGDRVQVSGPTNTTGQITATSITIDEGNDIEIVGVIADLDSNTKTFKLGVQLVNYGSAMLSGVETLENGLPVIVFGTDILEGQLVAIELERDDDYFDFVDELDEAEIEGIVSSFSSAESFKVNGFPVITTEDTAFEGGAAQNLELNSMVEVAGRINQNLVLIAERVEFLDVADAVIVGVVEDVLVNDGHIPTGSFVVLGKSITVTVDTSYEDESELDENRFNLSDINIGDVVFVVGSETNSGFVADIVERINEEEFDDIELLGVASVEGENLFLHGVEIRVTDNTQFSIEDEVLSSEEFFTIADGRFIEVEGEFDGDVFIAMRIEVDAEDEHFDMDE